MYLGFSEEGSGAKAQRTMEKIVQNELEIK